MELTAKELNDLEEMATALFSPKDCAIALQVDEAKFIDELTLPNSEIFKRYYKGYLSTKLKHNKSVFEVAQRGSSPAQAAIQKMIDDLRGKI